MRPIGRPVEGPRQRRLNIPRGWTQRPRFACQRARRLVPIERQQSAGVPLMHWVKGHCCDAYDQVRGQAGAYSRRRPGAHVIEVSAAGQAQRLFQAFSWLRASFRPVELERAAGA